MDKAEVIHQLKVSRGLYNYDRGNDLWKRAFELYNKEQGVRLSMKCSICVSKVKEWLTA